MQQVQPISALYHTAPKTARGERSYAAFRRGDFATAHRLADDPAYRVAVAAFLESEPDRSRLTMQSAAMQARALRELAGLTGDEVAERLGLARDTVYRRERGDRYASAEYLSALRWLLANPGDAAAAA